VSTSGVLGGEIERLLTDFTDGTPGIWHAMVVSADGLRLATSERLGEAGADQLAAASSGLVSLARGTANVLGAGAVEQTIIEMVGGYLFLTSMRDGSSLAVVTGPDIDLGVIGYEVTALSVRVGRALAAQPATRAIGRQR
jgi:predicted regulator of Ras-like GTPase activity (Roadblock/LC7/MglB family)